MGAATCSLECAEIKDLGAKMFDRTVPLAQPEQKLSAQKKLIEPCRWHMLARRPKLFPMY